MQAKPRLPHGLHLPKSLRWEPHRPRPAPQMPVLFSPATCPLRSPQARNGRARKWRNATARGSHRPRRALTVGGRNGRLTASAVSFGAAGNVSPAWYASLLPTLNSSPSKMQPPSSPRSHRAYALRHHGRTVLRHARLCRRSPVGLLEEHARR